MKTKNYIDNLYYCLFGCYLIVCIAMSALIIALNVSSFFFWLAWGMLGILLVIALVFYLRNYKLEKDSLKIAICFVTITIPYKKIEKVYITQNNRLSYATSKKRIGIKLRDKKRDIYISPVDMDDILLTLTEATDSKEEKVSKKEAKK